MDKQRCHVNKGLQCSSSPHPSSVNSNSTPCSEHQQYVTRRAAFTPFTNSAAEPNTGQLFTATKMHSSL